MTQQLTGSLSRDLESSSLTTSHDPQTELEPETSMTGEVIGEIKIDHTVHSENLGSQREINYRESEEEDGFNYLDNLLPNDDIA